MHPCAGARRPGVLGMLAVLACAGCSPEAPDGAVVLQLASGRPGGPGVDGPMLVLAAGDSAVVALGSDTTVVRRARLVVHLVALLPAQSWECEPDEGGCAELEPGPALIDVPLADGAAPLITAPAAVMSYAIFQVQIHTPSDSDTLFISSQPEFADVSVRIEGTYSRSGVRRDFVLVSDFNELQELPLEPELDVRSGDTVRVTLRMDLARMLVSRDGTALLDPARANPGGPDENLLRDNIRLSLAAFRDENQDGLDDGRTPLEAGRAP